IQQRGSKLWLVDGSGKFSIGQITSTGNISAANFGLTGTIGLGKIGWSNGTTWTKVALAGLYTVNGKAARVIQDGTTTVLVNPSGQTSAVRFTDPTHFIALDWSNLAGQTRNGGLLFANGEKWFRAETLKGAGGVSIQTQGTNLTFVD